jgi:putative membrane-bound dehydrogenase-like protein
MKLSRVAWLTLLAAAPVVAAEFTLDGRKFTLPDGFTVQRATTTNLVQRPVSASFDDQGRLYVTDSDGSNEAPSEQLKHPGSRVVRLEDTDGDGVFDKSAVFADKVMFPQGCLWHDGWVYVAGPPSIWRFKDADGDGKAELREEWFKGGTLTGCANDIHGPYLGPDGYIYWTKGAFSEQTHKLGNGKTLNDKAAHIYRARPDGSDLDVIMSGGMDNPVEVAFTPEGEALFTSTFIDFSQPGFRDGIAHAIHGGVFGKVNDVLDDGRVKRTGPDLMHPFVQQGAAATCGLTRYASDVFGADYRDNLFATSFNLHKVTRHILRPSGATYVSTDSDFLVSDDVDFHPTDVLEDADGSLLVVDTGGWYKLCCPSSQLAKPDVFGAVYRVRKTAAKKLEDPWGQKLNWSEGAMAQMATRLDDARPAVRSRAVAELARLGTNAVPILGVQLKSASDEVRRGAIWALAQIPGRAARIAAKPALLDDVPSIRHTATKAASLLRDRSATGTLASQLHETNDLVLRSVVEAFGRVALPDMGMMLFNVTQQRAATPGGLDPTLEHSIIGALIELAHPQSTRLGLNHSRPVTRRAALIALDQMDGSDLAVKDVIPHLTAPDERMRTAAHWIMGRHPDWGGDLAAWLQGQFTLPTLTPERRQQLHGLFPILTRHSVAQQLLASVVTEPTFTQEAKIAALNAMADAGLKDPPAAWKTAVLAALGAPISDPARSAAKTQAGSETGTPLLSSAIRAARSLNADAGIQSALLTLARNSGHAADLRLEALAALPAGTALSAGEFDFARAQLQPAVAPTLRSTAAGALGRVRLDSAQLAALTDDLRSAGPLETGKLLAAFGNGGDDALGQKLVAALRESKSARALTPGQLKPHFAKFPEPTQKAADAFLATLNTDAAKQAAHLDALLGELQKLGGDQRRGQAVFNGTKAACAACHRIGYLGGNVGPELTEIGKARTERDLLEAIVYPSASFVRSYEPTLVTLKEGEQINGLVKRETPEEILLATGPGAEQRLRRSEVTELQPGTISVMPGGLDEQLTRQELADLLRFMKDVRWR